MQHRGFFGVKAVKQVAPCTVCEAAVRLCAETSLSIPDASCAATALRAVISFFVSNRTDFCRVQGLPNVGLDDLVAA